MGIKTRSYGPIWPTTTIVAEIGHQSRKSRTCLGEIEPL
jgi:hypothetical protein